MSKYNTVRVYVPDVKKSFVSGNYNYSNPAVKKANMRMVVNVNEKYGDIIQKWASVFEIPKGVIVGFICTESAGVMAKPNQFLATGLMQVTPNAIWDCARRWNVEVSSPLPSEAKNLITSKIPNFFTTSTQPRATILNLLQNDANFNVMSGTLVLRWLLERFGSGIVGGQLNKAMVGYNAGAYTKSINQNKSTKTPVDSTSLVNNPQVPKESRGYLLKMLGQDGFLSLIYKEKAI